MNTQTQTRAERITLKVTRVLRAILKWEKVEEPRMLVLFLGLDEPSEVTIVGNLTPPEIRAVLTDVLTLQTEQIAKHN